MRIIPLLLFVSLIFTTINAQDVVLRIKVLYDGEIPKPAGKSTVYLSDGQILQTNKKGELKATIADKDSIQLLRVDKIEIEGEKLYLVNHRFLQYIPLGKKISSTIVTAYVLSESDWNERKAKIQSSVNKIFEIIGTELSAEVHQAGKEMQMYYDFMRSYIEYKPRIILNLSSVVFSKLSDSGKIAYHQFMKAPLVALEQMDNLEASMEPNSSNHEDALLYARLSVLSFNPISGIIYLSNPADDWSLLGTMMEAKEVSIVFDQNQAIVNPLKELLQYVKDPQFQAINRNDLASIYVNQKNYEEAIKEARLALNYYHQLAKKDNQKYWLETTAVMFNLGSAYKEYDQLDNAIMMFDSVLQRINQWTGNRDAHLNGLEFFANKFIANMIGKKDSKRKAYPYYHQMFQALGKDSTVALSMSRDLLFGDYLNYCEGKELNGDNDDEVAACYENSINLLNYSFSVEKQTFGKTIVYHKLAEILQEQGQNEKALEFYNKALAELTLNTTPKARYLRMELLTCLGELMDDYGRDTEALDYFRQGMKIAQMEEYENDPKSMRQHAISWYKTGQIYYARHEGDSALLSFLKAVEILAAMEEEIEENKSLLANTYNMLGAVWGQINNDDIRAEEYFKKSVGLYKKLADVDSFNQTINYAMAVNNLLELQSRHFDTVDKSAAIAMIDDVMLRFIMMKGKYPPDAKLYMENMNTFLQLYSGQIDAFQQAILSIRTLTNKLRLIKGNNGKSDTQSQIIARIEEANKLAPESRKDQMNTYLSSELGNLAWYALFDHQFALAEKSARKALEIDSSQIWVNTNLAHSLILQNKIDEGKAVYDEYKDVENNDGRKFRVIFLNDIEELKQAGIKHPAWEEVVRMLRE